MLPELRIGQLVSHGSLTVFPLFCEDGHPVDYLLSDEAMEAGTVTVSEVTEQGRVPELVVENKGLRRALFLESEELRGAKQNRILNTSVLVPAQSKLTVPVSCVEQGRWKRTSPFFMSSKQISPSHLRGNLKRSVNRSLKEKRGHRSDQGQVWADVRKQQESLSVTSDTSAQADTYEKHQERLAEAEQALRYVPGACGLAVAIGSQVVTVDLFDKPATCEKVWGRLLSGVVLDALMATQIEGSPDSAQVMLLLEETCKAGWEQTDAVGEGEEYRAEFDGNVGSVLLLDGRLVHGSVVGGGGVISQSESRDLARVLPCYVSSTSFHYRKCTMSSSLASAIETVSRLIGATRGLTVCYDPPVDPATDGVFRSLPPGLHSQLSDHLARWFPDGLFRHQMLALQSLLTGHHTVVATRTSSGKSLIYRIPVFDRLLNEPDSTALFFFPQKALANDQLQGMTKAADDLSSLAQLRAARPHLIARYDGATPDDLKPQIRAEVQVLLTNPDMLHYAVLAWHERHWQRFLSRLRYVVVDECHEYRGIFGTNVSYLFRRLRALCHRYGSSPTFIATSATVQSPQEHMERLTGLPFASVGQEEDGSRQGERKFWMVRPEEHPYDAGRKITLALAEAGLTVLTFSPSRTAAERMIARSGRDNMDAEPPFVRVYRAGLTPLEREEIERGLRDRTVRAVFSTTALELGIDIGAIDVVVCVGLPTTMMSLWQRAGRAGRAGRQGAVILIPGQTPIDAYYAAHPDRLFARDHEPLVLNLSNQRVLHLHYACAAKEAGDEGRLDTATLGPEIAAVKAQRDAGLLREEVFYLSDPHRSVRIRGTGDEAYDLLCDQDKIGEIDPFHLLREAPRNGIYLHGGLRYRVKDVVESQRRVRLARELSPHFTTSAVRTSIRVRRLPLLSQHGRVVVGRASLDVNDYLVGVTEKHVSGAVVRSYQGAGGMPNNWLPTEGTMLRLERPLWEEAVARLGEPSAKAGLETIARLFGSLFPTVTGPCDASDYSAAADAPKDGPPAVYLYDMVPYGVGLAVEAFDRMADLVKRATEQVRCCPCVTDEGCFQCVRNPQAEVPASKAATLMLLEMMGAELAIPPVVTRATPDDATPSAVGNCPTCQTPRQSAARFCSNCGTKLEAVS